MRVCSRVWLCVNIYNLTELRIQKRKNKSASAVVLCFCSFDITVVTSLFVFIFCALTFEYSSMPAIGMNENHWFYYMIFCVLLLVLFIRWMLSILLVLILLYISIFRIYKYYMNSGYCMCTACVFGCWSKPDFSCSCWIRTIVIWHGL